LKLLDSLQRVEDPFASSSIGLTTWEEDPFASTLTGLAAWEVNNSYEGEPEPQRIIGPGATDAVGWYCTPEVRARRESCGAHYRGKTYTEGEASVEVPAQWYEDSPPTYLNSFAVYVDYHPMHGGSGYAAVIGRRRDGTSRLQFVPTHEGVAVQAGEVVGQLGLVDAIGIQVINKVAKVWKRVAGKWSVALTKTQAEIEALAVPGGHMPWYNMGLVAIEALGPEGRTANLYAAPSAEP
jgi:hypothetical protein